MLNKKSIAALALSAALVLTGCGLSNTAKGTGIGAGAGALIGAGVGRVLGNTAIGAAIGGVVGGTAGALIGKKMDKQKKELEKSLENAKVESINEGQAIRVTFDSGILFATGKAALSDASRNSLVKLAKSLEENPQTNIQIVGHTDNTGSDRVNDPLSVNRAKSVFDYLASQGVSNKRMEYAGKGSKEPVADNTTVAGRQANRRVEVYILPSKEMISAAENGTLK